MVYVQMDEGKKKEVKKTNWTKKKNKKRLLTWTKPLCTCT